jgi:tryptophanyl-tRNA synthetase
MSPVMGSLYEKRKELEKSPDSVKEILIEGSARAREIARETLGEVRQAMKIQY